MKLSVDQYGREFHVEKNYLAHCSEEDFKRMKKKLKEAQKEVRTGKSRKFRLTQDYVLFEDLMDFVQAQTRYFYFKWDEVSKSTREYLESDSWARENRFYNEHELETKRAEYLKEFGRKEGMKMFKEEYPEQRPEDVERWAEKVYVKRDLEAWEFEYEVLLFEQASGWSL